MKLLIATAVAIVSSALAGCGGAARPEPSPGTSVTSVSADSLAPSNMYALEERVDRLLAHPEEVALRVGETLSLGSFRVVALDADGDTIQGDLKLVWDSEDPTVAEVGAETIHAHGPGSTELRVFPAGWEMMGESRGSRSAGVRVSVRR